MSAGNSGAVVTVGEHPEPVAASSTQMLSNLIHVEHASPMERDRIRAVRHLIAFLIWVGFPTMIGAVYYGSVASDMYVSEAKLTVRNVERSGGVLDSFISKTLGSGSNADASLVQEYMKSRDMVQELVNIIDIRTMYSNPDADPLSRLKADASFEALYKYFSSVVRVDQDATTGVMTLQVRAFSPQDAQIIGETMISLADVLMDTISERARTDALGYAKAELVRLEQEVRDLNLKIMQFRIEGSDIDPMVSARSSHRIVAQLEAELVKTRTQLAETESYMRPDSTQVQSMRTRISALEAQLNKEKMRLTGPDGDTFTQSVSAYEELLLERNLVEKAYSSALAGYETAKADAQQRQAYLVAYVPPNLPDEALYPRRMISVLTVAFGAMLFYGIGTLLLASIKEHSRV